MRRLCRSVCLIPLVLLFAVAACVPQPLTVTREPVTLRLVTADTCGPLTDRLAEAYEDTFPWVTIQAQVFNTHTAQQVLQNGEADLALLSWVEDHEQLWFQPFARDGILVVVHPDMPFAEIRLANLREIYQGRVQEWGGLVLSVVSREEGSGTRVAFENVVLGNYEATRTAVVMPSNQAVIKHVATTPGGIGYVSSRHLETTGGVRVLPVEGVALTPDTLANDAYPLTRSLYLATVGEPTGEARAFAQWVLGPDGQVVVD